ncbi:MAG: TIM-barrel domain-containing protein, partial [Pseudomonadota bacterium]
MQILKLLSVLWLIGAFSLNVIASNVVSINADGQQLYIQLDDGKAVVRALNQGAIEVHYQPDGARQLPSFAIDETAIASVATEFKQVEDEYLFELPEFQVKVFTSPYRLAFLRDGEVISEEEVGGFITETLRGFRFTLRDGEQLYGGGQRVLGMDRRGHRMPLYNKAHYGYTTESNQMYYGLPAVMSSNHYAIGFDNSATGHLDIGYTQDDILQFEAVAGRTGYVFAAGDNLVETVNYFVSATGKQPLPPRWALGNYASRFGYKSQQEVIDVANQFIEKDFPLDALVLDLYWFGPDIKGHMGNLNWDKDNWPNPVQMIDTLLEKGVKTILITEPFILTSSREWSSAVEANALAKNLAGAPRTFDFYFGNTGLVDVFDNNAQDWFWQYYEALNKQGVSGWWGDLGEPEVHPSDSIHNLDGMLVTAEEIHNAFGHQWAKMVYERQLLSRPSERPFVMMRAGFLGTQRYGMIPWTGDVARSWGGLKPQVELSLQMGLFGLAYTHSDLGGFAGGEVFDAELYTRWMQYGVFQPVYRPHAQAHIPPEPIFHDEKTQDITRQYINLRYRLMPYNYSLSIENSKFGIPMMRPLSMHYPKQSMTRTDAYLWGRQFLVAPIVNQGQVLQDLLLPEGIWFDYFDGSKYRGGQSVSIDAPLEKLPVLVRAGAFVPTV